jgi:hypothetical protein
MRAPCFALCCAVLLQFAGASEQGVAMETGLAAVEVIARWIPVRFSGVYTEPAVVTGIPTSRDSSTGAVVARVDISNVTAEGFQLRVTVADCLWESSGAVDVPWLVSEVGVHNLCDVKVSVGTFEYKGEWRSAMEFADSIFLQPPTVLLQIQDAPGPTPGSTAQLLEVSSSGFGAQLQAPPGAQVAFVAFEQGSGRGPNFHTFHANTTKVLVSNLNIGFTNVEYPHQVYETRMESVFRTEDCG